MMKKTKKLILAAALCAAGMMTTNLVAAEPLRDAVAVWHMKDLSESSGRSKGLQINKGARVGVELSGAEREASLARGGDGYAARFDGGWLAVGDGEAGLVEVAKESNMTIAIRFKPEAGHLDGSLFTQCTYSPLNKEPRPGLSQIDVSAWYEPFDELGAWRLFCSKMVKQKDHRLQREAGCRVTLGEADHQGWHDLVMRIVYTGGEYSWVNPPYVTEVYIDGVLRGRSPYFLEGIEQDTFTPRRVSCQIGAEPLGNFPFKGLIDHVAVWGRALSDGEIEQLSARPLTVSPTAQVPPMEHSNQVYFEKPISREEAYPITDRARAEHLKWLLKNDKYFPRYHTAGLRECWNTHAFEYKGIHHLFPIGNTFRSRGYAHDDFYYHHLTSKDLVYWRQEPLVRFEDSVTGKQRAFWPNATFVYDKKGAPLCLSGKMAAVPIDDMLREWKVLPNLDIANPPPVKGALRWRDHGCFRMPGDNENYYLVTCAPEPNKEHHLYKSADLHKWEYIGLFSDEIGTQEGVQVINVKGKFILFNMPGDRSTGIRTGYRVGRIEGTRFVIEKAGAVGNVFPETVAYPEVDEQGNLVCLWQWIWSRGTVGSLNLSRRGWSGNYSLPQRLELNEDLSTSIYPIDAVEKLRKVKHSLPAGALEGKSMPIPGALGAQQEIALKARVGDAKRCGVSLEQGGSRVEVFYDAGQKKVAVSAQGMWNHDGLLKDKYFMPLELDGATALDMRVFLDGNLLEVYANGRYITCRVMFDEPAEVRASIFTDGGTAQILSADAWEMDTAWLLDE